MRSIDLCRPAARGLALLLAVGACAAPPAPSPGEASPWEAAARASRPYTWRLEAGPWDACTIVVRAARPLADDDVEELDAILTDWYNLARLGAFRDDPHQRGGGNSEAMGEPWQPARDALASTFHLGTMGR